MSRRHQPPSWPIASTRAPVRAHASRMRASAATYLPRPAALRRAQDEANRHLAERHLAEFGLNLVLLIFVLFGLLSSVTLAIWAHDVSHAHLDASLEQHVGNHVTPELTAFMLQLSWLGNINSVIVTVPLLLALLLVLRRPIQALTLFMSVMGGVAVATTFKPLVARLAPGATSIPPGPLGFNNYSFPSGHAVYFLTCFIPLTWFLWEWRPQGSLSWRMFAGVARVFLGSVFLTLTVLGGLAQIYLANHWPSDVAGGYAIGGFWSALVLLAYTRYSSGMRTIQPTSRRAPPQASDVMYS